MIYGMLAASQATEAAEEYTRLFGLDVQLLFDAFVLGINIFLLFFLLSYLLFNPVRNMLKKRQEGIRADLEHAKCEREETEKLRLEYEAHLKHVDQEAELILSKARKEAMKNQAEILEEAREDAARIRQRAQKEIELERARALDEMKQEMVTIASMMAAKAVAEGMNVKIQESLVDDTLKEMGESTWQS